MKRLFATTACVLLLAALVSPAGAKVPPGLGTIPLTSISCPGLTVTSVVGAEGGTSFYLMPSGDHYVLTYISVSGTFTPAGSTTPIPVSFTKTFGNKTGKGTPITCTFTQSETSAQGTFVGGGTVKAVKVP